MLYTGYSILDARYWMLDSGMKCLEKENYYTYYRGCDSRDKYCCCRNIFNNTYSAVVLSGIEIAKKLNAGIESLRHPDKADSYGDRNPLSPIEASNKAGDNNGYSCQQMQKHIWFCI